MKILFFLILLFPSIAWAKLARISWQPIDEAIEYELEIEKKSVTIEKKKVKKSQWEGALDPGVYHYRIRAIDFVKRPGDWSELHPLILKPQYPELTAVGEKGVYTSYAPKDAPTLFWKKQKDIQKYLLVVKKDKTLFLRKEVSTNSYPLSQIGHWKFLLASECYFKRSIAKTF